MKKLLVLTTLLLFVLSLVPGVLAQDDGYTIAFVPGVNPDPFYITMSTGVNQAATDLGVNIIQQDPERFDVTVLGADYPSLDRSRRYRCPGHRTERQRAVDTGLAGRSRSRHRCHYG